MTLASELDGAVSRGEIVPYYQPQIDVVSGRIVAVEALSRWEHPEIGLVPPVEFIAIAEESGAIHSIGQYMIEQGCDLAASLRTAEIEVAVNVSAVQLADSGFGGRLTSIFRSFGLRPEQLTIELTESRPVVDMADAVAQLQDLRSLGIGVSIDDFGSGHSSLAQLEALPFSELKIDQALVRESADDTQQRLSQLVAIVRERGLRIVAEGIETQAQYDRVRAVGCDRAQGFFLGAPMPRAQLESLIA